MKLIVYITNISSFNKEELKYDIINKDFDMLIVYKRLTN